jgi:hypothetical protein
MVLLVWQIHPSLQPEVKMKCLRRPQLTSKDNTVESYPVVGASTVFPLLTASSQQLQPSSGWGGFPGARPQGPGTKSRSRQHWWGHELKLATPQIEGMHNPADTLRIWKGVSHQCYHLNGMLLMLHKLKNPPCCEIRASLHWTPDPLQSNPCHKSVSCFHSLSLSRLPPELAVGFYHFLLKDCASLPVL